VKCEKIAREPRRTLSVESATRKCHNDKCSDDEILGSSRCGERTDPEHAYSEWRPKQDKVSKCQSRFDIMQIYEKPAITGNWYAGALSSFPVSW
jgi:hypothetical protein